MPCAEREAKPTKEIKTTRKNFFIVIVYYISGYLRLYVCAWLILGAKIRLFAHTYVQKLLYFVQILSSVRLFQHFLLLRTKKIRKKSFLFAYFKK